MYPEVLDYSMVLPFGGPTDEHMKYTTCALKGQLFSCGLH